MTREKEIALNNLLEDIKQTIDFLEDEKKELKEKLEIAKKALEFYAKEKTVTVPGDWQAHVIIDVTRAKEALRTVFEDKIRPFMDPDKWNKDYNRLKQAAQNLINVIESNNQLDDTKITDLKKSTESMSESNIPEKGDCGIVEDARKECRRCHKKFKPFHSSDNYCSNYCVVEDNHQGKVCEYEQIMQAMKRAVEEVPQGFEGMKNGFLIKKNQAEEQLEKEAWEKEVAAIKEKKQLEEKLQEEFDNWRIERLRQEEERLFEEFLKTKEKK